MMERERERGGGRERERMQSATILNGALRVKAVNILYR